MPGSVSRFGVVTDGKITVNGVDLSSDCQSFTLNTGTEAKVFHAMSDNTNYSAPGLYTWSLSARFFHDFAASKAYATLKAMALNRGKHNIIVQNSSAARSSLNPGYSGLAFISAFNMPVGAAHGEVGMTDVTWTPAGDLTELLT